MKDADEIIPTSMVSEMDRKRLPRKVLGTIGAKRVELPADENAKKVELETKESLVELPDDRPVELPAEIPVNGEKESPKSKDSAEG